MIETLKGILLTNPFDYLNRWEMFKCIVGPQLVWWYLLTSILMN